MKRVLVLWMVAAVFLFCRTTHAAVPQAPTITKSTAALQVSLSWPQVEDADGYILYYAPYPSADPIENADLGVQTDILCTLWDGAAFYVAVRSYNGEGLSPFSNIEHFVLHAPKVFLPADDAAHDEPSEWWYWTGHLEDDAGRWYGFEEVFFLARYEGFEYMMAHHTITDIEAGTFSYDLRYGFGGLPDVVDGFSLSLGNWTATGGGGNDHLRASVNHYVLDVELAAVKPPVLQHGNGYTDYDFGGYTYYYSRERMAARGTLEVAGETRYVTGWAWFDHQWGSMFEAVQVGWDWFAIQLDDGREIMLFALLKDGEPTLLGGSMTDGRGETTEIASHEFAVTAVSSWTSPATGCTYPSGWEVTVGDLSLIVTPVLEEQELPVPVAGLTYWEGAATVNGDATGRAYIELTGYCD
jgi:predicted secreted hydrolase